MRTLEVRFSGQAAEDWRRAYPELPPGPEVVLQMEVGPCVHCGYELGEDFAVGALDPTGLTDDGILVGDHVCLECMKKGH